MEKMTNAKIKRDVLLTDFDAGMGTFGEPFGIGEHKITVDGVRLLQPADTKTEFPAGEACIAVHVKVQNGGEYSSSAPSLEMPYIGYTDQTGHRVYKNTIGKYDFDLYEEHYQVRLMESYDYRYEVNAEGDFIYFVDAGADSAILCFEERSHEKGELEQLIALCEVEIPLPKEVGE